MHTALRAVRCPLLVGRDDLLELADRRLEEVTAGRGQFLLLAGEAGIGKTRLLAAIRRKAEIRGFSAVNGAVAPQDRDVPAASVLDLARSMTRLAPFADLGRELLELSDATRAAEHVQHRRLVMELVERILISLPGPTMLSFEDLQWADDVSLEVIAELARQSRDRQLLLTGDYRTEEVAPGASLRDWRARLITQRIAEEVRLAPLTETETALVTTLILDTGLPAPREVAAAVFERTGGIPLHIEELLGALSAEARADGRAIREATVPDTIEDAVMARIAQRSPEAQAAARAGAVIGRCFVPEVLAGIMDVPPESLEAPLQELVDHFVLDPPGLRGLYDFRHQLLRDALYRTIPTSERRRFHARAAEFGAQLEGASEIHASVHYERAGLRRQAFGAAVAGAREAWRLLAHREAFELYRRAVANLPDDVGAGDRGALFDAYAVEALAVEENALAERAFRDARAAYMDSGQPAKAAEMLVGVLHLWSRQLRAVGDRSDLAASLFEELDGLPAGTLWGGQKVPGWLFSEAVRIDLDDMAIDAARSSIETMREDATAHGDTWAVIEADELAAMVAVLEGRVAEGLDGISAAGQAARERGFEELGIVAYRDVAVMAARVMEYRRATDWIADGLRYADAIEQSHCRHVIGATSALVAWAGGDWGDAAATARQAIADQGSRRAVTTARWVVGYVALGRGDFQTAETELTDALLVGEESGAVNLILPPLWGLAEAALLADRPDEAAARCHDALERARATGERALLVPFVVTGIRAEQAAGRPAAAEAWLAACAEHLSAMPVVARPALEHAKGLVALAAGATGVARHELEAAVGGWDERGRIWEATWARLDLANCLTRLNRFTEAAGLAVEARAVASRLDSRPLADRADVLQRMAHGHVSVDEPWRPLTAREFAVARLIADGLTNGEIATELSIASRTASSHVEHILAKLGASRRTEIASWVAMAARAPASAGRLDEPEAMRTGEPTPNTVLSIRH
ncbi:MAG TPA: BREX system ATP-binding domain-containing protein [Candidatus Limnocylindrales bacterium]